MWACKAAKLGYHWLVGDEKSIRFWEDQWFGGSSLSIQFWELYVICNEQMATLAKIWDDGEIKLSFRRAFGPRLFEQWDDLVQIVSAVDFTSEPDQMIWKLNNSGIYSSQSLYAIVNFKGIQPVFVPSLWNIYVPLRIHMFLWLVSNNRILTRNNLSKRQELNDKTCLFCNEPESVTHLLFDCVVAKLLWTELSTIIQKPLIDSYENVATYWLCNKRHGVVNMISSALVDHLEVS